MKLTLKISFLLATIILILALTLPSILNLAGLHPKYKEASFDLEGKKALIIATNHGVLNKPGETDGKAERTSFFHTLTPDHTTLRPECQQISY